MSKLNSKILKLARLLKFYQETKLNDGTTISHEGTLEVNSEVFIEDENGDIVPLADGEYLTEDNTKLMVEGGKVIAIVAEEAPLETVEDAKGEQPANGDAEPTEPTEHEEMSEQPAEPTEPTEPAEPTEPDGRTVGEDGELADQNPAENSENAENGNEELDELKAENADLKAKIAELEAIIADYKEKEKQSVDSNVDDAFKSQENKKVVSNIEYVRSRMK